MSHQISTGLEKAISSFRDGNGKLDNSPINPSGIKDLRRKRQLTQQELADLIGVSVDTVRSWEGGRRGPSSTARVVLKSLA